MNPDAVAAARVAEYVRQRNLRFVTGIDREEISSIMFDPDLDWMAQLSLSDLESVLRLAFQALRGTS